MHILLTDILTCPRCGPEFGLIVLADALADRQVLEGRLGCANCRESYPIHAGVADLRGPHVAPPAPARSAADPPDRAYRTAALLGVGHAPGMVLVESTRPELPAEIDRLLPNAQVLGASASPPEGGAPPGLGWVLFHSRLPFRSGALRGAALLSGAAPPVQEAARALAPGARLVIDPAPPGCGERLRGDGLELLLEQDGVAVASVPSPR